METITYPAVIAALLALASPALAEVKGDASAGEKKAQLCILCHRTGTLYGEGIPLLEGRPAPELVAAITAFKKGERTSPAMQPNVERLTARDIADISAYFASRPATRPADYAPMSAR